VIGGQSPNSAIGKGIEVGGAQGDYDALPCTRLGGNEILIKLPLKNHTLSNEENLTEWQWQQRHTLEGHTKFVSSVAFSHNSALLASESQDNTIRLWELSVGQLRYMLKGHTDFVHYVAFSHDSALLASASGDKTIGLWDLKRR
jgi:WD40 repeat protein